MAAIPLPDDPGSQRGARSRRGADEAARTVPEHACAAVSGAAEGTPGCRGDEEEQERVNYMKIAVRPRVVSAGEGTPGR